MLILQVQSFFSSRLIAKIGLWPKKYGQFNYLCIMETRARNNGRSTDNVRTDWGVDQSTFRLAGHVDWSQPIVLKMKSVVSIDLFTDTAAILN